MDVCPKRYLAVCEVMSAPVLNDDLSLSQGVEDLAVQQFIAHSSIEQLAVSVLPGTAGGNVGTL